jgi:outer membrane cobalamin receptor
MNIVIHRTTKVLIALCFLFYSTGYPHVYQDVSNENLFPRTDHPIHDWVLSTSSWTTDSAIQNNDATSLGPKLDFAPDILASVHTQEQLDVLPDSVQPRTYSFQEVVITSARIPQTASYTPSAVTVLSKHEIELMNGISLAEVISPAVGVFIKNYGAGSGLKTISQRGLGTEHTLILLNGLRVSSLQNGLMDLGSLSVDGIESVEIVRGGQSALYGADAVAGLINIVTLPSIGRNTVRATSSFGSFGYRRYHVSGGLSSGLDGIRISYGEERGEEDFPYVFRNGPQMSNLNRRNADLTSRYADIYAGLGIGEHKRLTVFSSAALSERGVGGPIVSPFSSSVARQVDKDYLVQAMLSFGIVENVGFGFTAQAHVTYERYLDPSLNIGGRVLDSYFKNNDVRIEPHVDITVNEMMKVGIGSELVRTSAEGNSMVKDVARTQLGTFLAGEVILAKEHGGVPDVSLFPSVRLDAISSMTPTWSPQLGALVGFGEFDVGFIDRVRPAVRSSVSRNFRMPTFNELYFNGGGGLGNSALRPERSTGVDVGASVRFLIAGEHVAQTTYFMNDMSDRIVWVAAGSGTVSPKNLRRVRSQGLESSYRWDLPEKVISLQASYTTANSRKVSSDYPGDPTTNMQMIYVPQEVFTLSANSTVNLDASTVRELGVLVSYSFVGYRYYTEDNTSYLPIHRLVNVNVRSRFAIDKLTMLGKLEVNNLFDEEYQVMLGYPMPLRSYRVTFGIEY